MSGKTRDKACSEKQYPSSLVQKEFKWHPSAKKIIMTFFGTWRVLLWCLLQDRDNQEPVQCTVQCSDRICNLKYLEKGEKKKFLAAPWQFMSTCRGLSGVGSVTATVWTTFTTTLPLWSGRMRLSHLWSTYTESVLPQVHLWWWGKGTWTLEQPKSCFFKDMEEVSAMIQEVHRPAGRLCGEVI